MDKMQKNTIYVSVITSFVTTFMGSALSLSIPNMEKYFKSDAQSTGWVITVYMLTCALLAIPFGRIADKLGKTVVLRIGIILFSLSSCFAAFAGELWVLLFLRFIQGIGAAMVFSTNIAILVSAFNEEQRGKILGYSTCAMYTGLSAGPVLGGFLNYRIGWQSIFIVAAAISAISAFGACFRLKKERKSEKAPSQKSKSLLSELFKNNSTFVFANLAALINYGSNFALTYMLSIYLQVVKGMTSQNAGLILVTNTVAMSVLSPVFGKLSDRIKPERLAATGMTVCTLGMLMLALLHSDASIGRILFILIVMGIGLALFSSPNSNVVMSSVERKNYGLASSVLSTMRSAGHTLSMAVVYAAIGIYMGKGSLADASSQVLMKAFNMTFWVFTVLCFIGIFMAVKRKM